MFSMHKEDDNKAFVLPSKQAAPNNHTGSRHIVVVHFV
jgi:hypothetical protein